MGAPALRWTKNKPTVDGWYWHRGADPIPSIYKIIVSENQVALLRFAGREAWTYTPVNEIGGEWAGPIEQPQEA